MSIIKKILINKKKPCNTNKTWTLSIAMDDSKNKNKGRPLKIK